MFKFIIGVLIGLLSYHFIFKTIFIKKYYLIIDSLLEEIYWE